MFLISRLASSLAGQEQRIVPAPGSLASQVYAGAVSCSEKFSCNFGLNRELQEKVLSADLRASGHDDDGHVRIVEIREHPYFIATLFLPQLQSSFAQPHPLITEFLRRAAQSRETDNKD